MAVQIHKVNQVVKIYEIEEDDMVNYYVKRPCNENLYYAFGVKASDRKDINVKALWRNGYFDFIGITRYDL